MFNHRAEETHVSDYAGLSDTVDRVVLAAIDAEMYRVGCIKELDGSYTYAPSGIGSSPIPIPGPGQGTAPTIVPQGAMELFDPNAMYAKYQQEIPALFEPFLPGQLPEPSSFEGARGTVLDSMIKLAMSPHDEQNPVDTDDPTVIVHNPDLTALTNAQGILNQFSGDTVTAFREKYLNHFEGVLECQYLVARELWVTLHMEQEVWTRTEQDIARIADSAIAAFEDSKSGGFDLKLVVDVVGSVLAIAALHPAVGAVTKAASTVVGQIGKYVPKSQPQKTSEFSGGTPDEVLSKLREGIETFKKDIASQEDAISERLRELSSAMSTYPDCFDLSRPTELLETDAATDVVTAKDEIALESSELRRVGREHLPQLADQLRTAANGLDDPAPYHMWLRSGGVGAGYTGPWTDWERVANALVADLLDTQTELRDGGETLAICADAFDHSDAHVAGALDQHRKKIEPHYAPPPPPRVPGRPGMQPY